MAADIGTAYVRVAPNMTGIQSKIAAGFKGAGADATKMLGDEVDNNSSGFQKAIGKLGGIAKAGGAAIAAGLGVGIVGLTALTGKMLNSGAELEQQLGGSEAVFGEFADSIKESATTAYFEAGLSQNEFLQGANKMGSLFQGAGFSVKDSMKMSQDAMQRASDVASIMGIDTTAALEAVTGMAKGNFTMMDNLGVAMNDTALGAYALTKGITKSTAEMSIQEKVGLAQQLFLEKTAKYAGNYAKENQTLAGSLNSTKKAFQDLLAGEGEIDGFMELLVNTVEIAAKQVGQILPKIVNAVGIILPGIIDAIAKELPNIIPALIGAVTGLLQALVDAMPTVVSVIANALPAVIDAFIQLFLALVNNLPIIVEILAEAIPQIVDALVNGLTNPDSLMAIISGGVELLLALVEAIPIILPALIKAIPTIIQNILLVLTSPRFISMMINAGFELIKAVIVGIYQTASAVGTAAVQIYNIIKDLLSWENMKRIGGDMVKGLWQGITDLTGWVIGKIKGFSGDILGGIKSFFGIHSPSTVFAGIGADLNRGLAKGIEGTAGLVSNSVNDMSNQALSALSSPDIAANYAVSGAGAIAPAGNSTSQSVSIGQIVLGNAGAVQEFFKQLNQDSLNATMGITPNQGSIA